MNVIVAGLDPDDLGHAIEDQDHDVTLVDVANRPALEEAGVLDTDVFVLTEIDQATSIAIAKDLNADLKVVVYARGSLPDFARRQADLVVDPELIGPDAVAEELVA